MPGIPRTKGLISTTMTTAALPAGFVRLVVGYDGSAPASRALDAAVRLLQGRSGRIDVVYVTQLSSLAMLSPGAIAEIESDFDEIEQELRAAAAGQLDASGVTWEFERHQGIVTDQLIAAAAALRDTTDDQIVVIVVGSSSHATHRALGSVAVGLARHSPVPLVIVP
jgi:nucleotide-binding universal stress UspA family protein